ncbi:oligosaccharide flippase family protein [Niastella sp. OAS944]|uniref:oligosaccharide flippase family protein n=1 Tax=Niastella sp. OAS944 TaxID=2664089 RepID=UPI003493E495|nr:O-antigen/teichoic acid export membrane protein [Chitinophagaceae bacterium OAS944]
MSLLKNSTIVVAGVFVSNLLAYGFHFVAGRLLGPQDYGVFGALMSLFLLVALPAGALSFAITKFTARFNFESELGMIGVLRKKIQNDVLVFSGIILLLIVVFANFIASFLKIHSNTPVIIIGITLAFSLLLPVNRGILQGLQKFLHYSWNTVIEAFIRLILLVSFLFLGMGVNGAILAYGLAYFIAFLWIFPYIKETKDVTTATRKIDIKPIYKFIFQVLTANMILQSVLNIPSLLIKHFYSSEITGNWVAALNLARLSLFLVTGISLVMFPQISKEKNAILKKKIFYKSTFLVLIATSGMAIAFFFIPQFLIQSLYGKDFDGAVPILQYMGFAMIFFGLLQLRMDYFLASLK